MSKYIHTGKISSLINKTKKPTIAIDIVFKDDFNKWNKGLTNSQKKWVKTNNFTATHGSLITFTAEEGNIDFVAFGLDKNEIDPWVFSKLSSSLPDGLYKISNELVVLNANQASFGWAMADYKFERYLKEKKKDPLNWSFPIIAVIKMYAVLYVAHV